MQILHPFCGTVQQYSEQLTDPDRCRPSQCPLCKAREKLRAHGFYYRSLVDESFDGVIAVRRYLCRACWHTMSLLPEFALPYLRFSIFVVRRFLKARLVDGNTLVQSAQLAAQPQMPYQRAQQWARRFHKQAQALAAALVAMTPPIQAISVVVKTIRMLEKVGWVPAHRFLFSQLRIHLLGWPDFLAPEGLPAALQLALNER